LNNWSLGCNVHKASSTKRYLVAQLDCLSFTQLAIENKYVCPELDESFELDIKNGRHPVIEKQLAVVCLISQMMLDRETQQLIMQVLHVREVSYFTSNGFNSAVSSNGEFCSR
jgi:hypothetical protein